MNRFEKQKLDINIVKKNNPKFVIRKTLMTNRLKFSKGLRAI